MLVLGEVLALCLALGLVQGQFNSQYPNNPQEQFRVVYEWFKLDYAWPDDSRKAEALRTNQFVPESNALTGVKVWRDRLYLTVPRWREGVPATLVTVPISPQAANASPRLEPFPSWAMQELGNCSALQSVRNIEIDAEGRLWAIDTGRVNILSQSQSNNRCPPKLVILDLNDSGSGNPYMSQTTTTTPSGTNYNYGYSSFDTNNYNRNNYGGGRNFSARTLLTYTFPDQVVARDTLLMDIVVDSTSGGYAYISDASPTDPGIIVFSRSENRAWKVRDRASMLGDPQVRSIIVNGQYVDMQYGLDGLALSPATPGAQTQERTLYYSPLSSYTMYSVSTNTLRDSSGRGDISSAIRGLGRKASVSDGMVMDNRGNLYYGLLTEHEIARWDTKLPFSGNQHNISKDINHLQWPASFGFDTSGGLYAVTNRFQNFLRGRVNLDEPNYRVIRGTFGVKSYLYPADYSNSPGGGYNNQGTGYNNQGTGYNNQGGGFNNQGTGYNNQGTGYNNQGTGYNNQGTGYNNQGTGYSNQPGGYNPYGQSSSTTKYDSRGFDSNNPNSPNYNPNNPSYNPNNPNYDPNNPNYNPNNPGYNPNNPNYDPNNPNYDPNNPNYNNNNYNNPNNQYGYHSGSSLPTPLFVLAWILSATLAGLLS